ncbi:MAG: NUDIX domain-containing protein [Patescibacteria group bacterium UBA2163]
MKILAELTEKSLGIEPAEEILEKEYRLRKSARAVLVNDKGEVSLQNVSRLGFYKLPGGGVELGETEEDALRREVHEEVGCAITDIHELGVVMQYFTRPRLLHIAYGYLAQVDGAVGEPSFEEGEIADGMKPLWCSFEEARTYIDPTQPLDHYEGQFIRKRERIFLDEAARQLGMGLV